MVVKVIDTMETKTSNNNLPVVFLATLVTEYLVVSLGIFVLKTGKLRVSNNQGKTYLKQKKNRNVFSHYNYTLAQ